MDACQHCSFEDFSHLLLSRTSIQSATQSKKHFSVKKHIKNIIMKYSMQLGMNFVYCNHGFQHAITTSVVLRTCSNLAVGGQKSFI